MAFAVRIVSNPANKKQHYILWSNGYLQNLGGALPITQEEASVNQDNNLAPTFYTWSNPDCAIDVQIIDWSVPSGYVINSFGHIFRFGGVTAVPGATFPRTGVGEYLFGLDGGFATPYGYVSGFIMDPAGNGRGYMLTWDGDLKAFGTGVTAVTHGAYCSGCIAYDVEMDWSSKRYWVADSLGRIHGLNGGNDLAIVDNNAASATYPAYVWGRGGRVGFKLYDKAAAGKGWMQDGMGRMYAVGGALFPSGYAWSNGVTDTNGDVDIIDDGTGANPLRLIQLNKAGGMYEFVVSTAPTVTVLAPTDPTTDSTRPYIWWSYADREGNPQATYQVRVIASAVYGGGGFDPATSTAIWETTGTDKNVTRVQPTIDLPNDTYRAYVRCTDTSNLSNSWVYKQWVQNVSALSQPTITVTSGSGLGGNIVAITAATGAGLPGTARFLVQYHDSDWDGSTWLTVRGAEAITPDGSGKGTAYDYEARFGVVRTYRCYTYTYDTTTGAWRASTVSTSGTGTLGPRNLWVLSSPTLNGLDDLVVAVQPGFTPTKEIISTTFKPVNRQDPIVITDGKPKLPTFDLAVWALDNYTRTCIEDMMEKDIPLLLRDPFGRAWYFRVVDNYSEELLHAQPLKTELTSIRDAHVIKLRAQAIKRPTAGMTAGPLKES